MNRRTYKKITWILIINLSISFILFSLNVSSLVEEIDVKFGESPIIDGQVDSYIKEWENANKIQVNLVDLPVKLWVLQNDENLYISLQFDLLLKYHSSNEFMALLISNSSSENPENFIDAKIIQFNNISNNEFEYLDYHIDNKGFSNDTFNNGRGAASLNEITSIYEFSIPIGPNNKINESEDVLLDYEANYAFNITYGEFASYPQGIKKSEIFLININSPPTKQKNLTNIALFIILITFFAILGILYGFYLYKIYRLKDIIDKSRH